MTTMSLYDLAIAYRHADNEGVEFYDLDREFRRRDAEDKREGDDLMSYLEASAAKCEADGAVCMPGSHEAGVQLGKAAAFRQVLAKLQENANVSPR